MIYVKPKQGLRVRHPENPSALIPKEGTWITESTAVMRLVNSGDLVVDKNKQSPKNSKTSGKEGDDK